MEKEVVDYDFKSQLLEERKNKIEGGLKAVKFNEEHHLGNRLAWTVDLFYELDQYILSLNKDIRKEYIIRRAFQGIENRKGGKKTPLLKKLKEVEQIEKKIEIIKSSEINILAGENGYLSINLKIHKSQRELLNRILQETILK